MIDSSLITEDIRVHVFFGDDSWQIRFELKCLSSTKAIIMSLTTMVYIYRNWTDSLVVLE